MSIGIPAPQLKSKLLTLPSEIRIMVYRVLAATCVVGRTDSLEYQHYDMSMLGGHVYYTSVRSTGMYIADYSILITTLAGPLQVCRQINHELTQLVTSWDLRLDIDPHFVALHSFLTHASADLCSARRKMCLRYVMPLDSPPIDCDEDYERRCFARRPAEYLDLLASRLSSLDEVEYIPHSCGGDISEFYDVDMAHQLATLLRRFRMTTKLHLTRRPSHCKTGAC